MKRIGITGGIGAGKSIVLDYIAGICNCRILQADQLAWELEDIGGPCYDGLLKLLGEGILTEDGRIDRKKMGAMIFGCPDLVSAVNRIVHPVVKKEAVKEAQKAEKEGYDYFFFEAALLIESGCDAFLDEVWYIYAPRKERLKRLMNDRGYTREKALSIMRGQLSEKEFRQHADRVIDNSGDPERAYRQCWKWLT